MSEPFECVSPVAMNRRISVDGPVSSAGAVSACPCIINDDYRQGTEYAKSSQRCQYQPVG